MEGPGGRIFFLGFLVFAGFSRVGEVGPHFCGLFFGQFNHGDTVGVGLVFVSFRGFNFAFGLINFMVCRRRLTIFFGGTVNGATRGRFFVKDAVSGFKGQRGEEWVGFSMGLVDKWGPSTRVTTRRYHRYFLVGHLYLLHDWVTIVYGTQGFAIRVHHDKFGVAGLRGHVRDHAPLDHVGPNDTRGDKLTRGGQRVQEVVLYHIGYENVSFYKFITVVGSTMFRTS